MVVFAALLVIAAGLFWMSRTSEEPSERAISTDAPIRFSADGAALFGFDLAVEDRLQSKLVTVAIAKANAGGWSELTLDRMRGICGAVLTYLRAQDANSFDRKDVFRVDLTTNPGVMGAGRDRSKDVIMPVNVRDGACQVSYRGGSALLGMPAPLQDWQLSGVTHKEEDGAVEVIFDQFDDISYRDALDSFDPLAACSAAMLETFPSEVTPLDRFKFDSMTVIARNFRGNSLLNFSTSRSWTMQVIGGVCGAEGGVEG